jgi:type III pantothenate kinase
MILLVDAGNTRIKWATLGSDGQVPGGACPTIEACALGPAWRAARPTRAVVACVAGESVRADLAGLLAELGVEAHWVRAAPAAHGLVNPYHPPEALGVDRYAAMVGASRRFGRDCVVVGIGTAMTADMLTSGGAFLGGCIVPGPELMRESLSTGTAGVGPGAGECQTFPLDTGAAVATGIVLALLGVVRGMRERLGRARGASVADLFLSASPASGGGVSPTGSVREGGVCSLPAGMQGRGGEGNAPPAVVLTGGARACLAPLLEGVVFEVDELVLEGLAWIARDLGFAA